LGDILARKWLLLQGSTLQEPIWRTVEAHLGVLFDFSKFT